MPYTWRCYYVHSVMILEQNARKTKILNWTVFGEIHTANTTFIACSTRFHLISRPVKNLHRIPTNPRRFITVPISLPMGIPVGFPTHTTVLPNRQHVVEPLASYRVLLLQGSKVCRYNWHSAGSLGWPFSMLNYEYIFRQYTKAVLSNSTRELLWFEITKMLIAVWEKKL